jgi:ketosteroid isomerase-like protein
MALIPARTKTWWPAVALSGAVACIGFAFASMIPRGEPKSAATDLSSALSTRAGDTGAEDVDITAMIGKYAESIDKADITMASQIWSNSTEVSFIHPLGHEQNLDQIKQNVYGHLMGDTFSERKLSPRDISVHAYGDVAWAEFYWDFTAKFRKDGTPITTHGRETQIYRREQGGWRLVHVHYSAMPVSQERKGF